MEFGVPKEVRDLESRAGLTPAGVLSLVQAGHTVHVERNAGAGAGFSDEHYRRAGARIVYTAAEAYGRANVVLSIARPMAQEHQLFRPGQSIFSFFHLPVASSDLLADLSEKSITAISYETIQDNDGSLPVLIPMSEVAGRLAPVIAGQLLTTTEGGRGILLSGIPGVARAIVAIVGGGTLGQSAARAFVGLGAQVIVLDRDVNKLRMVDDSYGGTVTTMIANEFNLNRIAGFVDVLVGAILVPGKRTPALIRRDAVRKMRPGAVIIDFSIDQGGCVETSRPTTLRDPTFVAEQVIHHCVPNITSAVARTASHALTNTALPYLQAIGELGLEGALETVHSLRRGVSVYRGQISSPGLADALGRELEIDLRDGVPR
ncbi:MAG: alanine dehydrogenase [Chloroflexota bacterium]|nr:alanine dehydrogenase [Chloroflexota bacterium]